MLKAPVKQESPPPPTSDKKPQSAAEKTDRKNFFVLPNSLKLSLQLMEMLNNAKPIRPSSK